MHAYLHINKKYKIEKTTPTWLQLQMTRPKLACQNKIAPAPILPLQLEIDKIIRVMLLIQK